MTPLERPILELVAGLAEPDSRERAATELARYFGAKKLFAFMADAQLDGALVPAPGFAATLPGGKCWREFLTRARAPGFHEGALVLSKSATTLEHATAFTQGDLTLVFVGAAIEAERLEAVVTTAPLLCAILRAEYARFVTKGELDVVRQAAKQSAALARALEGTRLAYERTLTELEEQASHLERARAAAESAGQAKDDFLAMLGHELRNPLTPIVIALELLDLKEIEAPEIDIIARQVAHIRRLIDDLLDVSRITQGKIELRKVRAELGEIIERAVELASPIIEKKRQPLSVSIPPSGLMIDADPARLAQVLSNLLINAAKYSPAGQPIAICAERDGATVCIRVSDKGIGLAPEQLTHIFERFVQNKQAANRSEGGLGLGLAIVNSLVHMHAGTVTAHSLGLGHGSEFVVTLPAASEQIAPVRDAPASAKAVEATASLRILVVDDNVDAASLLSEFLRAAGHTTRTCHDGPTALRVAAHFQPDVAVLDIGLPVMDGYELAQRLRDLDLGSGTRLIAVTGYGQAADHQNSLDAGFEAHFVKPVELATLRAHIERAQAPDSTVAQ
ncbi:MAG: response regulator [Bradymonadaceae bacterium]|nr:response regulator [Lujinxingiaceae bacterium]